VAPSRVDVVLAHSYFLAYDAKQFQKMRCEAGTPA
jgi:hypothetical protein